MFPDCGQYRPAINLAKVLLPQPDLPTIATTLPPGIVKEKSSSKSIRPG